MLNSLCNGCKRCIEGKKGIVYITGICKANCFYCPIPLDWRNEVTRYGGKITDIQEIPSLINNKIKGVSITGGDPIFTIEKSIKLIKLLKDKFGKEFHIHLYTHNLHKNLVVFKQLEEAGLDELRIHIVNDNFALLQELINYNFDLVVEIPSVPRKFEYYIELLNELEQIGIKYLNLNQFEFSYKTNEKELLKREFERGEKKHIVMGSESTAKKIIEYVEKNNYKINVNYCSAKRKEEIMKKVNSA